MGSSRGNSVVRPTLETWDVENLFITDGSVVPTPLAANPQLTIMALATKERDTSPTGCRPLKKARQPLVSLRCPRRCGILGCA